MLKNLVLSFKIFSQCHDALTTQPINTFTHNKTVIRKDSLTWTCTTSSMISQNIIKWNLIVQITPKAHTAKSLNSVEIQFL